MIFYAAIGWQFHWYCIELEKLDLCRRCCGGEQSKGPFHSREPEESVELAVLLLVFWGIELLIAHHDCKQREGSNRMTRPNGDRRQHVETRTVVENTVGVLVI